MLKKSADIKILAFETSFDETASAILLGNLTSAQPKFKFLSSIVKSQLEKYVRTGGVVPEVAARAQMENILPVTELTLQNAKLKLKDLDYIAVTSGPGLVVSLIVGTEFAKGLSLASKIPLMPTNHMAGHLYSAFAKNPEKVQFPVLSIIVSGGHTMFVLMKNFKDYKVIGETVDDAAGEAFDKVARLLALPYPGGPEISKLALQGKTDLNFPRPMVYTKDFQFSFSGLKTSVLYYTQKYLKTHKTLGKQTKADIAMSFENAVVDVLISKAVKAVLQFKCKTIALSGGVAANSKLREELLKTTKSLKINFSVPDMELCTDNAKMIALAAYFNLRSGKKPTPAGKVRANPSWEL